MTEDIIIIGAGASGLMAASELSERGMNVLVLEADSRIGGRIHTVNDPAFPAPLELGAEFVHGKLPLTLALLDEGGIKYEEDIDATVQIKDGKWITTDEFISGFDQVIEKMSKLKSDLSLRSFLDLYFSDDKFEKLRKEVIRFAAGFDLADVNDVSTMFLYKEWSHENETQYRIPGGYKKLVDFLAQKSRSNGSKILTGVKVENVSWAKGRATVTTSAGKKFESRRIIITVPIGILKKPGSENTISFEPSISVLLKNSEQIGFGSVIKYHALFDNFFSGELSRPAIILSDSEIPTWWVKFSGNQVLLSGWLGGPAALEHAGKSETAYRKQILKSLSAMFNVGQPELEKKLKAFKATSWADQPFARGAYSYDMVGSRELRRLLRQPIGGTIFFSGEGLYDGGSPGTVEAALSSGKETASRVLSTWKFNNA